MRLSLILAWRNLRRHTRRSVLTTGAMIFSNVLLVFMLSLQFGMYQLMTENTLRLFTGHLQVQAPGYKANPGMHKSLPNINDLAAELRQALALEAIAPRALGFALVSSAERSYGAQIVGVSAEYETLVSSLPGLVKQGRYLRTDPEADQGLKQSAEVVMGAALARNLKLSVGDELSLFGTGRDGSFAADVVSLVGIYESGSPDIDRHFIFLPLARFQDVFSMQGHGHSVVIMSDDFYNLEAAKAKVDALLAKREGLVLDWDQLQPGLKQAIEADMFGAWFMYGVLILLVALSVLNTQLMSVLERTREFGLLLALGLQPLRLFSLVMLEAAMMASLALLIGVALGSALLLYFQSVGLSLPGMEAAMAQYNLPERIYPTLSFWPILIGPLLVFFASILASVYPAVRLLFLQAMEAMRSR